MKSTPRTLARALLPTCAVLFAAPALAQTPGSIETAERTITQPAALDAARAALDICTAQGYRVVVVVADASGNVKVTLRADGARPHLLEGATRKAHTAALVRIPTAQLADTIAKSPSAAGLLAFDQFTALGGGLPIRAGNEVIGGIGVAGVPVGGAGGAGDEGCAKAGLEKIGVK
jgi:uncharacterized protein GlcG (DUF336 family)